jgi:hypothetical protein
MPEPHSAGRCPSCSGPLLPIVYGLPGPELFESAERGEVALGGCMPSAARHECRDCGWVDAAADWPDDEEYEDPLEALFGANEDYDELDDPLPSTPRRLMSRTAFDAHGVRERAERLATLPVLADALLAGIQASAGEERWLDPAERFAAIVHHAAGRVGEAVPMAERAIDRMHELFDAFGEDDGADDDERYEQVLTARLHVPVAAEVAGSAVADAVPALRHLARLALASAVHPLGTAPPLERLARGVLRMPLDGSAEPTIVAESPALWSVTLEELRMELAGVLANLVVDRRTHLTLEVRSRRNRYVQAITFDRGLHAETVADPFLPADEQLTVADHQRLLGWGWVQPEPDDEGSPNWYCDWDDPVDVHDAADQLVRTLVEIHGLDTPTDLTLGVGESVDPFG